MKDFSPAIFAFGSPERIRWTGATFNQGATLDLPAAADLRARRTADFFRWMVSRGDRGTEIGGMPSRENLCLWTLKNIRVKIVVERDQDGGEAGRKAVVDAVNELRPLLEKRVNLHADSQRYEMKDWKGGMPDPGVIIVHLARSTDHAAIARKLYNIDWMVRNTQNSHTNRRSGWYSYHAFKGEGLQVQLAMVDPSGRTPAELSHLVSTELVRCLGLGAQGYFDAPVESIFAPPKNAETTSTVGLTALDKYLIRFAYSECNHGDSISDLCASLQHKVKETMLAKSQN